MACRIKGNGPNLWTFETRHCLHGESMERGQDFDFSCSPTVSYPAMKMQLAATASKNHELFSIDVSNCFQSDDIAPENRVWIDAPVCYTEWFQLE